MKFLCYSKDDPILCEIIVHHVDNKFSIENIPDDIYKNVGQIFFERFVNRLGLSFEKDFIFVIYPLDEEMNFWIQLKMIMKNKNLVIKKKTMRISMKIEVIENKKA